MRATLEPRPATPWRSTPPPSFDPQEQTAPEQTLEVAVHGDPIKILIVDDDESDREALLTELAQYGITNHVEFATSGKEAIRRLRSSTCPKPDVVLLEMYLHDLSGREVLHLIKRNPSYRDVDVIALTHYAEPDFVRKVYEEGAVSYIRKPFSFQSFLTALRSVQPDRYGVLFTGRRPLSRL